MKRNAKTIVAGIVALAMSHAAMAKDIKVAVVGAMSGPVAQWGDMEFNGARQAIKDINASGGIKGDKLVVASNMTTPAIEASGRGGQQNRQRRHSVRYRPPVLLFHPAGFRHL